MNNNQLKQNLYLANGNFLSLVLLPNHYWDTNFKLNPELRRKLTRIGKESAVDSSMILTGNPLHEKQQGYHLTMDVFEPNGSDNSGFHGSWSTMCGNGVLAVTHHCRKMLNLSNNQIIKIKTQSGTRQILVIDSSSYQANMGEFTEQEVDLAKYVNTSAKETISNDFLSLGRYQKLDLGLSGTRSDSNQIDGEPHAVFFLKTNHSNRSMKDVIKFAEKWGPYITKNKLLFPNEINSNFAIVNSINQNEKTINITACTHERGLGDDPKHSITGACGTGATAIAAKLFKNEKIPNNWKIEIEMPGGKLLVRKEDDDYLLTGKVQEYEN